MGPTTRATAMRIVVVDDHEDTRDMTAEVLAADGFDVHACSSARAALRAIHRDPPDAVVTDLRLGDESGIDLAIAVRDRSERIVVIAVTGTAEPDARASALFDAYCVKPIDLVAFPDRVRGLVHARRG